MENYQYGNTRGKESSIERKGRREKMEKDLEGRPEEGRISRVRIFEEGKIRSSNEKEQCQTRM